MRILAFSDWRVQEAVYAIEFAKSLPKPVDVIVYAGDDIRRFKEDRKNYLGELARYSKSGLLLAVAGNDDLPDSKTVLRERGVRDLHDRPFQYNGIAFLGLEGSTLGPGYLKHTEKAVMNHLLKQEQKVTANSIVIVSHPPPSGVLDEGIRFRELGEDSHSIGSTALRDFVRSKRAVKLVICGHCHSRGGLVDRMRRCTVVNVASHDSPGSEGRLAIIDFEPQSGRSEVSWFSTEEMLSSESLCNLHEIGPSREQVFKEAGINSIKELAALEDLVPLSLKTGMGEQLLIKFKLEAKSRLENKVYQIAPFDLNLADPMYFDIETDLSMDRVWLVGVLRKGKFDQFYAESRKGEKKMLEKFLSFLKQNTPSTLVSYSSSNFDRRVLLNAFSRLGLNDAIFRNITHVDLATELNRCFVFPIKHYTLKDVGKFFGYSFKHPELDGSAAAFEYTKHVEERTPLDRRILEYNRDDVSALACIIDSLSSRLGER